MKSCLLNSLVFTFAFLIHAERNENNNYLYTLWLGWLESVLLPVDLLRAANRELHYLYMTVCFIPQTIMCGSMGIQERGKRPTIRADLREGDEDSNFSVFRTRRFTE